MTNPQAPLSSEHLTEAELASIKSDFQLDRLKWTTVERLIAQARSRDVERIDREAGARAAYVAMGHELNDPWNAALQRRYDMDMGTAHTANQLMAFKVIDAILSLKGGSTTGAEPIGCPCPGACSVPSAKTPDQRASIICDFMNWPEDGPAWKDAHKLAALLVEGGSTTSEEEWFGIRREDAPTMAALAVEAIERVPNWNDSGDLVTAKAHCSVLADDLPYLLGLAPPQEAKGADSSPQPSPSLEETS